MIRILNGKMPCGHSPQPYRSKQEDLKNKPNPTPHPHSQNRLWTYNSLYSTLQAYEVQAFPCNYQQHYKTVRNSNSISSFSHESWAQSIWIHHQDSQFLTCKQNASFLCSPTKTLVFKSPPWQQRENILYPRKLAHNLLQHSYSSSSHSSDKKTKPFSLMF